MSHWGVSVSQVAEVKRQVAILESYLEQRGAPLPEGYLSYKVVCPNPNFRCASSSSLGILNYVVYSTQNKGLQFSSFFLMT